MEIIRMELKAWTVRLPLDVLEWLRVVAAEEQIKRRKIVSMNTLAIEIFQEAMKKDLKKKEGKGKA
jgi:hypothetical protein